MKLLLIAIVSLTQSLSFGAIVFSDDFTGTSFSATSSGNISFGTANPNVAAGEYLGSANGTAFNGSALVFNQQGRNRSRAAGIWLDPSTWSVGEGTVSFDVSNFALGSRINSTVGSQVLIYSANNVSSPNGLNADLHGGTGNGIPALSGVGSGSSLLLASAAINSNGTVSVNFDSTGTDQFIGIFFVSTSRSVNNATQNTFSLDNLTVQVVPEPSFLFAFGSLALTTPIFRKRRNFKH